MGALQTKTSQDSTTIGEFLAGLRFEQRGKLADLSIAWQKTPWIPQANHRPAASAKN